MFTYNYEFDKILERKLNGVMLEREGVTFNFKDWKDEGNKKVKYAIREAVKQRGTKIWRSVGKDTFITIRITWEEFEGLMREIPEPKLVTGEVKYRIPGLV